MTTTTHRKLWVESCVNGRTCLWNPSEFRVAVVVNGEQVDMVEPNTKVSYVKSGNTLRRDSAVPFTDYGEEP